MHDPGVRVADEAVAPFLESQNDLSLRPWGFHTAENAIEARPTQMGKSWMSERSLTTKRYGVPAFSFVTFLPLIVSPIVKPGPTVPVTVFVVAAWSRRSSRRALRPPLSRVTTGGCG